MSAPCEDSFEELCGCCTGSGVETPEAIDNRPALPAVTHRVGRYATFNASMIGSLSDSTHAPVTLLRTRDASDFSLALIDAWAVTLDILTFYQERFANEAFLRTATDQRSVFELARLVGYVPSPGVAASAVLAFSLSSAPGSPDSVLIPAGTRVQSVPGPGQKPQVFETGSDLTAVIDCNALRAQTTLPWHLLGKDTSTWIQGTANKINVGDALLFVSASGGKPNPTGPGDVHYVTSVQLDSTANITKVSWDGPLADSLAAGLSEAEVCIYIFRKKAALYGAQAPNAAALPGSVSGAVTGAPSPASTTADWNYDQYRPGTHQINLDASYPGLKPSPDSPQWVILTGLSYTSYFCITAAAESNPNAYTLTTKTTQLTLDKGQILTGNTSLSIDSVLRAFVNETRDITAYVQSERLSPAGIPTTWSEHPGYRVQPDMLTPVAGTQLIVEGGQLIAVGQPLGVSGKRLRLRVAAAANATFTPDHSSGALNVAAEQIFLVNEFPPTRNGTAWAVDTLSGISGTLLVDSDHVTLLPAEKADPLTGEATVVGTVSVAGDFTTLGLKAPLTRIYDAQTVTVNANAVNATHGETVQEILGSGDATNDALRFTLKQAPLTYVTASTANGSRSTLEVWVNNLQWHEVPNLLSSRQADRAFVTRVDPAGKLVVQFGDGIHGARTPTGQTNVRAVYRKGIGGPGMVNAGQLTQPIDRPQGLSSVTNPSAASGAADPASADDARASAPLPTLTIGRVVSLEDYQNFALAFAGIAKALATWTFFSGTRGIFLTVAGEDGAALSADDPIISNLTSALVASGNPFVPLRVVSYQRLLFQLAARVSVDRINYDTTEVLARVWQNLSAAFSFERRLLAQGVAASEVVRLIQDTPGVLALQLQSLSLSGSPAASVPALLCASGPLPPVGAQLLALDPASQANLGVWS